MRRLLILLPLALLMGASPVFDSPDWRLDPLGAAIAETGSIEDTTVRAEERGRMIQALEHAGFLAEAEAVLNLAIEEAVELGSGEERGKALGKLAAALWRIGGDERAQPLWDLALEHGGNEWLTPEVRATWVGQRALRDNTPELVPEAFAGVDPHHLAVFRATEEFEWRRDRGEVEIAKELLDGVVAVWRGVAPDDGFWSGRLWPVAFAERYLTIGAQAEALALVREVGEDWPQQSVAGQWYSSGVRLAVAAHRAGDDALAGKVLESSYEYILAAPERLETRWWVRRGFQNWWRRAIGIDDTVPYRDHSFADLAVGYFKIGLENEGRMVLALIRNPDAIRRGYADVALALAKMGEEETAFGLVEGMGDGPARQGVLNGAAMIRFDNGDTEGAWELWRQVWHDHASLSQDRLLRHWRDEGAVEMLMEFVDESPQGHLQVWAAWRAVEAISEGGPTSADIATVDWLQGRMLSAYSTDELDHALKSRVLEEFARGWHLLGEQERAQATLEEAERIIVDLAVGCPTGSPPKPSTKEVPALCAGLTRHSDWYQGDSGGQVMRWAHVAVAWARIGEFERALELVESAGLLEVEGAKYAEARQTAWQGIGIAMLEQGVAPPGALAGLVGDSG